VPILDQSITHTIMAAATPQSNQLPSALSSAVNSIFPAHQTMAAQNLKQPISPASLHFLTSTVTNNQFHLYRPCLPAMQFTEPMKHSPQPPSILPPQNHGAVEEKKKKKNRRKSSAQPVPSLQIHGSIPMPCSSSISTINQPTQTAGVSLSISLEPVHDS
jgi:hypothetical protein